MNEQEILDNAPEGATVVFNKNAITACGVPAITELLIVLKPRSLADIKRIVELEALVEEIEDRIVNELRLTSPALKEPRT
jgi:hypothetical protein